MDVMLFGGRRDGDILQVPEGAVQVSFNLLPRFNPSEDITPDSIIKDDVLIVSIEPRKGIQGPEWKIDLPKELW